MSALDRNGGAKRGQRVLQLLDGRAAIQTFSGIENRFNRNENLRLDLDEAIRDRLNAHIWSAYAPNGAEGGAGEKRHHCLRTVGEIGCDSVATLDAQAAQRKSE